MSDLYEILEIDRNDLAEKPCGMLHCTGPALADTTQWLELEATAKKEGEVVGSAEVVVPLCPPHRLTWEVFMDTVPDDLLVHLYAHLIDLDRHPLEHTVAERIVDSYEAGADADGDEE